MTDDLMNLNWSLPGFKIIPVELQVNKNIKLHRVSVYCPSVSRTEPV